MNGNGRLYRSKSEAMLGGVAAGLANYFKVDPTLVRIGFLVLMLFTSGAFLLVYLAMWLLIPSAGSTAAEANQVVQENLNEIGDKVRGFTGGNRGPASTQGNGAGSSATPNGGYAANMGPTHSQGQVQTQLPQAGPATQPRHGGASPMVLIAIGAFFLLANLGFFRGFHWGIWWPLLFIGLGVMLLSRRQRA
jgi:phage shock protein PspC (stress-responsive transcriptional regulator)